MCKRLLLPLVLLCFGAGSTLVIPQASAMEGGRETRVEEIEANKVVRLIVNGRSLCTGVAIDEHWVLTAEHCRKNKDEIATVDIQRGTTLPAPSITGVWHADAPSGDIALVFVESGLGLAHYADISRDAVRINDAGTNYGWGSGTKDVLKMSHQKVVGAYTASGFNQGAMFVSENEGVTKNRPGDSGGPLFIRGTVAGITSSIGSSVKTNFSSVPAVYDWIVREVNSRPQPRSTEFMAAIDPGVTDRINQRILAAQQQRAIALEIAETKAADAQKALELATEREALAAANVDKAQQLHEQAQALHDSAAEQVAQAQQAQDDARQVVAQAQREQEIAQAALVKQQQLSEQLVQELEEEKAQRLALEAQVGAGGSSSAPVLSAEWWRGFFGVLAALVGGGVAGWLLALRF
ncbi:MAG: trypsin-like serine protease [Corynebacterium sp.]|uniref:trypsin-like serine protease n=1 Tax=Corynebacterium sp. TaxID=1720 RepID=UPI0026DA9D6D|nr:trypsin-like serine protease [Corynebacterium sp.]MDO4762750.1 trypsin-like serine protease [Corynebacterium sp.]